MIQNSILTAFEDQIHGLKDETRGIRRKIHDYESYSSCGSQSCIA